MLFPINATTSPNFAHKLATPHNGRGHLGCCPPLYRALRICTNIWLTWLHVCSFLFLPFFSLFLFLSFPSSSLQSHPPLLCHSLILSTLLSLRVNGGLKDVPIIFLAVGGKHYTLCEHTTNPAHYCRALCPAYPPWDRDLSTSIPTPSCERVVLLCHLFFFRLFHGFRSDLYLGCAVPNAAYDHSIFILSNWWGV